MKELSFKKAVKAELDLVIVVYTILFTIGEYGRSKTFMELLEDVIECWLDPEALSYMAVTWFVMVMLTLIIDLLRGFFFWFEIQKFNRKNRR